MATTLTAAATPMAATCPKRVMTIAPRVAGFWRAPGRRGIGWSAETGGGACRPQRRVSWQTLLALQAGGARRVGVEAEGPAEIVSCLEELEAKVEGLADELAVVALDEDEIGEAQVTGLVGFARRLEDVLAARDGVF